MKFLKPLLVAACSALAAACADDAARNGAGAGPNTAEFDILITGGRVIVGDGAPPVEADIGVVGDAIAAVGRLSDRSAATVIDADGMVVSPGFIDMHTHVDEGFDDPALSPVLNYLLQGVTTVRPGADGFGSYDIAGTKETWETNGMGVNAVMFAPHRVIRNAVMGEDQLRAPTDEELAAMIALVEKAMREGAWGVSAQLEYGGYEIHVTTEEMIAFSRPVADFGGFYVSHIRNEASGLLDAINETIEIGAAIGTRTSVTHLKATGRDNWGLMKDAVALINDARARGVDIVADQYPFLQGAPIDYVTALIDVPPTMEALYALRMQLVESDTAVADQQDVRAQFVAGLQAALRDPAAREALKRSTYEQRQENPSFAARWGWQDFRIKVAVDNAHYLEKNIAEIIDEENRDGFDIVADLVLSEPDALFAAASQSPEDMRRAMVQDWVMISSDGVSAPATAPGEAPVRAHPRSFASQAIVLRKYVREEGLLTLEEAVRKMTSLPAALLGMTDRGLLREGYKADIAVFDPDAVRDTATYDDARRYAEGFEYVLVNGRIAVADGAFTGTRAGKVLLKPPSGDR